MQVDDPRWKVIENLYYSSMIVEKDCGTLESQSMIDVTRSAGVKYCSDVQV